MPKERNREGQSDSPGASISPPSSFPLSRSTSSSLSFSLGTYQVNFSMAANSSEHLFTQKRVHSAAAPAMCSHSHVHSAACLLTCFYFQPEEKDQVFPKDVPRMMQKKSQSNAHCASLLLDFHPNGPQHSVSTSAVFPAVRSSERCWNCTGRLM